LSLPENKPESQSTCDEITIALAGNPNSGKTSVFNNLTGARQHVGNWPGVTVEKKEGHFRFEKRNIRVVDLPGTYSLTAYSMEEVVARNYIVRERPEVVVDIVDASNLERNLYLAIQLIELGTHNVVLALNMFDVAKSMGHKINTEKLSKLLGVPVVPTVARSEKGMDDLMREAIGLAEGQSNKHVRISYGREIESEVKKLLRIIIEENIPTGGFAPRWLAIKLLEDDEQVHRIVSELDVTGNLQEAVAKSRSYLRSMFREDPENVIADQRYGFITGLIKEVLQKPAADRRTITDSVDSVLVNRVVGLPVFAFFMFLVFTFTFVLGDPPMQLLAEGFERLGGLMSSLLGDTLFGSLVVDGVIGGVGGVIIFLPNILLLFFAIAILEDSGYMARAAFIMDRIMQLMGLHGKAFIPMLVGMGCSVPAVMSTRTLENWKDRLVTILIVPLASCGARLPVYILMAGAFFPGYAFRGVRTAGLIVFLMYVIGIVLAALMARLFRSTIFRGPETPFVMELPPYRLPTLKSLFIHMMERGWMYVRKAGTIILALTILIWFLMSFPGSYPDRAELESRHAAAVTEFEQAGGVSLDESSEEYRVLYAPVIEIENEMAGRKLAYSFAGRFGRFIEPAFSPIGFDWRTTIAMISGLAAKEVIVSTFGTIYSLGNSGDDPETLSETLRADPSFNQLKALVVMLFALISVPCVATLAIIKKETNSWRWPLLSAGYHIVLAWTVCFIVYQVGGAMGLGG